jgi:hypothetical protein
MVAPGAGPDEAAAIAAALEQFLHDTAPSPSMERSRPGGWGRAAQTEAVGAEGPNPWGDAVPWGQS